MTSKSRLDFAIIILLSFGIASNAAAQSGDDDWEFSVTPYLWLPTIDGKLKYDVSSGGGGGPNISVGPTDWLDLLNWGALVSGGARKGRYAIYSDLVYLSMSSKNDGRVLSVDDVGTRFLVDADVVLNTRTDLDGLTWTLVGGYDLLQSDSTSVNVFAGVRYFGVDVDSNWNLSAAISASGGEVLLPAQGSVGNGTDLWDGIIGIRGQSVFGNGKWSVPYHFDVGTGSSELTWNAVAGLAYKFDWGGDLMLAYRHLEYDQDATSLLQDFSFSGPAVGARFQF